MADVVGLLAASTQVSEQLAKSVFIIIRQILRAAKDLKDVPQKTLELIAQVEDVDRYLREVDPTYSKESRGVSRRDVGAIDSGGQTSLRSALKKLFGTLVQIDEKLKTYESRDKEREGKSKAKEFGKNLFQQGGTKQKKKVMELRKELEHSHKELIRALALETYNNSVGTGNKVLGLQKSVAEMPTAMDPVIGGHFERFALQLQQHFLDQSASSERIRLMLEQFRLEIVSLRDRPVRDQEHVDRIENDMVNKLIEAADVDIDNDSYPVLVEYQKANDRAWTVLEGKPAEDVDDGRRACVAGGYVVEDECSLRFTMSVSDENHFFQFLQYAHVAGGELKLSYPTRSNMKHEIGPEDSDVLFPNNSSFPRGPRRFAMKKDGSSRKSTQHVFLIFSRNPLVTAEAQSRRGDLEIASKQLEGHLEMKLGEEGSEYDEIIVKHFLFDIFGKE